MNSNNAGTPSPPPTIDFSAPPLLPIAITQEAPPEAEVVIIYDPSTGSIQSALNNQGEDLINLNGLGLGQETVESIKVLQGVVKNVSVFFFDTVFCYDIDFYSSIY